MDSQSDPHTDFQGVKLLVFWIKKQIKYIGRKNIYQEDVEAI